MGQVAKPIGGDDQRWTLAVGEHDAVVLQAGHATLEGRTGDSIVVAPVTAFEAVRKDLRDALLSNETRDLVIRDFDLTPSDTIKLLRTLATELGFDAGPGLLTRVVDPMSAILAIAEDPKSVVSARILYEHEDGEPEREGFRNYTGEEFRRQYAKASSSFEKVTVEVSRAWVAGAE